MTRLPQPGSDKGTWGDVLNDFLSQSFNGDGTIKSAALPTLTSLGGITSAQVDSKIAAQAAVDASQYETKAEALKVVTLTLAEYAALASPDTTTLYLISS